ncbi:hypothetical protein [Pandoraea sp. NPDC087047]|uniref:hypothetical protein n=1 Tax=Pandoraea sp. NPDC087047 TaxID=3364390 RepID=UPI00382A79EB
MRYSSHCRAINAPPSYQGSGTALSRKADVRGAPEFSHEFRSTRNSRRHISHDLAARAHAGAEPSRASPWAVALTVMLIANLATPPTLANPRVPRLPDRSREEGNAPGNATTWPTAGQADDYPDVVVSPVERQWIRDHYTALEFLRAVASSTTPFRNLGRAVGDAYSIVSGNTVEPHVLAKAERAGTVVDFAAGLIPNVQLIRLPGRLADVMANALEGKPAQPEKLVGILQFADPRALGVHMPVRPGSVPARPVPAGPSPVGEPVSDHDIEAGLPAESFGEEPRPDEPPEPAEPHEPHEPPEPPPEQNAEPVRSPEFDVRETSPDRALRIDGEREHLQGYEQTLPPEQIPSGPHRQLINAGGRYYLAGESGYYRITPGYQAGHWFINAPRGAGAQVPVIYNRQTGTWRAEAPLRLCGGGCAPSRESTPDSVAMSKNDVADAIRHIPDRDVRDAIQQAYADLAHLHLQRTNRADLRPLRDNSIVEHRRILMPQLMRLDPLSTLFEQQREAAMITAIHYSNYGENSLIDLTPEAFCQENAEILFHYLLKRGVLSHHIRMITVRPQGRPPHALVLYTESDPFIDVLDLSTPQPPVAGHEDGIPGDTFMGALFLTRESTVLLDPWSQIKATSFLWANDIAEVQSMLDIALADAGHRPGHPFTVSLTRPYPTPRERIASAMGSSASMGSAGSSGSSGGSTGESVLSHAVHRAPPPHVSGSGQGTPV